MFDYIKEMYAKEIERLEKDWSKNLEEESELIAKRDYLDSYLSLLEKQKSDKKDIIICILATIVCICGILFFININTAIYFMWLMLGFGSVFGTVLNVENLLKIKEELKEKYSDLSNLSQRELLTEKELVLQKIDEKKCIIKNLSDKVDKYSFYIKELTSYNRLAQSPFSAINSKEDAEVYLQFQKDNPLEKFLEEKVDYSMIHFDNSIGEKVEYKETPKQFIKKI